MTEKSEISTYYASRKILVTGSTGFMGKVLIWKLLRSCPELEIIYVLMRSKYGKSSMSRKDQFFGSPIFDSFKKTNPKILEKVVFVAGDVGEDGIGLSDQDRDMLMENVSIIFRSAAILKMNSDLRTAVNVNTVGTVRMLDMAQKMKQLEAFVYISTAYCCCENRTVKEEIYPTKQNPYDIINMVNWMEPNLVKKLPPSKYTSTMNSLIHPLPNTYIYSKRLTESLLRDYVSRVPIIVARPSIVVASFKEPFPGWTDSLNGPAGFFVAGARGVMRTSMLDMETETDVMPVDMVINSIILLPWANPKEQLLKQISVYNVTQNYDENLTWGQLTEGLYSFLLKYPLNLLYWYPNPNHATKSILVYNTKLIFTHYLPAYIIDFILLLVGQKLFLVRVYDRLTQGQKMLTYFTKQRWSFVHDNLLQLEKLLNNTDKQLFIVNMNEIINIERYYESIMVSAKIHLFKDDMNRLGHAKIVTNTMYVLDKIVLALRYYILWKFLSFIFNLIWSIFN